jgi:hypothetical protein
MKREQHERRGERCVVGNPTQRSLEGLRAPEIIGELSNPLLETVRRLWWRAFDRVCDCVVLMRLSIHNRIY